MVGCEKPDKSQYRTTVYDQDRHPRSEGLGLPLCFFVTDLHGHADRYAKLFASIVTERPDAVFLGGDLLPNGSSRLMGGGAEHADFVNDYLVPSFMKLRDALDTEYPSLFVILGNDDPRYEEPEILKAAKNGLWSYMHGQKAVFAGFNVYGYACVPPTPFLLKDWERYDVSRYVDPGCISPEEGRRSVATEGNDVKWGTIAKDLDMFVNDDSMHRTIFLFHTPPYDTPLDRAALDGKMYEHVALDVHVGSIAVRRFIERRQPLLTLHGHVHEAARLTGEWKTRLGRTVCINGAHDGPELALVRFDPESPADASRQLL
jgi:Icc-related predicted phosphoesterase